MRWARRVTAVFFFGMLVASIGCSRSYKQQASAAHPTAPELMIHYGCPACHIIPGVPGAVGKVGPSLDSLAQHSYLAGVLPNSPANLEQWLMHPQRIHPGTAMPEMGVTEIDADKMAAFFQADR